MRTSLALGAVCAFLLFAACSSEPNPPADNGDGGSTGGGAGGGAVGGGAGGGGGGEEQDAGFDAGAQDAGAQDAGAQDAGFDGGADAGTDAGVDAGYDFTCLGTPLPTTAPTDVTLSGVVTSFSSSGGATVANAAVSAHPNDGGMVLDSTTSGTMGEFSLTFPTGGIPVDGQIRSVATGFLPVNLFPAAPLSDNQANIAIIHLSSTTIGQAAFLSGASQSPSNAFVQLVVADCQGTPIAGATVSSNPAGQVRYIAGDLPSSSATATDARGAAFIFDVPPGDIEVSASFGSSVLRSHTVRGNANAITQTMVKP